MRVFTTFSVQMCRKAFILRLCRVFDHEVRTGNLMFLTPAKHLTFMTLACAKSFVRTAFRRTKKPMASNYDKNVLPPDSRIKPKRTRKSITSKKPVAPVWMLVRNAATDRAFSTNPKVQDPTALAVITCTLKYGRQQQKQ